MALNPEDFPKSREWADPNRKIRVIKWMRVKYAHAVNRNGTFRITSLGTWGTGVYAMALSNALSGIHYGQVGIIGELMLGRVFDTTMPCNEDFFREWAYFHADPSVRASYPVRYIHGQPYDRTMFSIAANAFKARFAPPVDTVVFHPDEFWEEPGFAGTKSDDIWFLVYRPHMVSLQKHFDPDYILGTPEVRLAFAKRYKPDGTQWRYNQIDTSYRCGLTAAELTIPD